MAKFEITALWLHQIDRDKGKATRESFTGQNDVQNFVEHFVDDVRSNKRKREFTFESESTEARTLILRIKNNLSDDDAADEIANALARAEKEAHKKYGHLKHQIQAGSLLQVFFTDGKAFGCLLGKVDLLKVLDKTSKRYREGLPFERYMMKACLLSFSRNVEAKIFASDSTNTIAAYWWRDFLGLAPVRNDADNTRDAFDAVEKFLGKNVKPTSPSDYRRMRSNVLDYIRNTSDVVFEDLISHVFGTFEPDHSDIDMEEVRTGLANLPETEGFDEQFSVDKTAIAKKRAYSLSLTSFIDLTIKDEEATQGTVSTWESGGERGIKIVTESGYQHFKE